MRIFSDISFYFLACLHFFKILKYAQVAPNSLPDRAQNKEERLLGTLCVCTAYANEGSQYIVTMCAREERDDEREIDWALFSEKNCLLSRCTRPPSLPSRTVRPQAWLT